MSVLAVLFSLSAMAAPTCDQGSFAVLIDKTRSEQPHEVSRLLRDCEAPHAKTRAWMERTVSAPGFLATSKAQKSYDRGVVDHAARWLDPEVVLPAIHLGLAAAETWDEADHLLRLHGTLSCGDDDYFSVACGPSTRALLEQTAPTVSHTVRMVFQEVLARSAGVTWMCGNDPLSELLADAWGSEAGRWSAIRSCVDPVAEPVPWMLEALNQPERGEKFGDLQIAVARTQPPDVAARALVAALPAVKAVGLPYSQSMKALAILENRAPGTIAGVAPALQAMTPLDRSYIEFALYSRGAPEAALRLVDVQRHGCESATDKVLDARGSEVPDAFQALADCSAAAAAGAYKYALLAGGQRDDLSLTRLALAQSMLKAGQHEALWDAYELRYGPNGLDVEQCDAARGLVPVLAEQASSRGGLWHTGRAGTTGYWRGLVDMVGKRCMESDATP
jgi:hypothetical protein